MVEEKKKAIKMTDGTNKDFEVKYDLHAYLSKKKVDYGYRSIDETIRRIIKEWRILKQKYKEAKEADGRSDKERVE